MGRKENAKISAGKHSPEKVSPNQTGPEKHQPEKSAPKNPAEKSTPGKNATGKSDTGRFAYDGLERIIHEKARLSVLSSLAAHPDGLLFNELKALCSLTDGNLSRQIQVLQEVGFVEVWKGFHKNRPQTLCRLTESGRSRFLEYISVLQNVITDAGTKARKLASPRSRMPTAGMLPAT
jgi:DNA-binding HxlR family transcriptional regulator